MLPSAGQPFAGLPDESPSTPPLVPCQLLIDG